MSNNNFDKHIREKLAGHEVTPSPVVWNNIEGHLASTARSQYRWLAGLFFLVVIAGAAYYFTSSQSSTSPLSSDTTSSSLTGSDGKHTPIAPLDNERAVESPSAVTSPSNVSENQKMESSVALNEEKASDVGKRTSAEDFSAAEKSRLDAQRDIEKQVSGKSEASDKPSLYANVEKTKKDISAANSAQSKQQRKSILGVAKDETFETDENSQLATRSKTSRNPGEITGVEKAWMKQQFEEAQILTSEENTYSPVQTAAFLTLEERQRKALDEFDICDVLFPSIEDCPKFGDRRRRYQIDAYSQVGMLFSHLTNNDLDVEVNSYLNQRRSTEVPTWYVGFGLRLSTQWTNGISLRGGLQVSESQIRVEYLDETQRQTTVNVSIDTLVDQDGNTTVVWDTISIIETGVESRQFHNTFTQIDIPLTVGYTFFGPRYDVEVNAGVMFNLLFQRSGRVFAPEDNAFYELGRTGAAPGTQPYRSELGLSLVTSVALNYRLSPQFSVFVEPQLRYFVDPVSPSSYALQENWFMGSLMLGGRYAF